MKTLLPLICLVAAPVMAAESMSTAATAINSLGIDLLHQAPAPAANFLVSPFSIQSALAMTYGGADGKTRDEMGRALHFPKDDAELNGSFAALRKGLEELSQPGAQPSRPGVRRETIVLTVANRLFGQTGYEFRPEFLTLTKDNYGALFQPLDFVKDAATATKKINYWVEQQTAERIRDLIPDGALNDLTRLVLVNAIYLKAPWAIPFRTEATAPAPFHLAGGAAVEVPTMSSKQSLGYAKCDGFAAVAIGYTGWDLHFLILLPDKPDGLAELEKKLSAELLAECSKLDSQEVMIHLPKFKLEPPALPLSKELQKLGMKSAFNLPRGSANFDRIAPRRGDDYLFISEVFHKTFLQLDEKGTEAAAATAVTMARTAMARQPIEVKVDHPFVFAIRHRTSGACLFLGHVTDPR